MSDMPPEALASMPTPEVLIDPSIYGFTSTSTPPSTIHRQTQNIDPRTGQAKKGRGRPPGSTNKVKIPSGGINSPSKITIPPSRNINSNNPVPNKEADKESKKLRADQYSAWIAEELNDKLFMFLIGASQGSIKPDMLYKEGKIPPKAAGNPNLTDFGNAIAIPADVADSWGKLFAELSYTDAGKSIVKASDSHSLGIAMAALTAVFSTYRYSQQVKPILDGFRKMAEAKRATEETNDNNVST